MRFGLYLTLQLVVLGVSLGFASGGHPQFDVHTMVVSESHETIQIRLVRYEGSEGALRVVVQTFDETATQNLDYNPMTSVVLWADGDSSDKVVTLPLIINDLNPENEESFWIRVIQIDSIINGTSTSHEIDGHFEESLLSLRIAIKDDDSSVPSSELSLDCGQGRFFSMNERQDQFSLTVCRKNGTVGEVAVSLLFGDVINSPRAVQGLDFNVDTQRLVFRDGEAEKIVRVYPVDDSLPENLEYSSVYLSNVSGSATLSDVVAVLRIVSNDAPQVETDRQINLLVGESTHRSVQLNPPVDGLTLHSQIQAGEPTGVVVSVEGMDLSYTALRVGHYRVRFWVEMPLGESSFVDVELSVTQPEKRESSSSLSTSKNIFDVSRGESAEFVINLEQESSVQVTIYDRLGREVTDLHNGVLPRGPHIVRWNGLDSHGQVVYAGAYTALIRQNSGIGRVRVVVLD